MNEEDIKWKKGEAHKLYVQVVKHLDFDAMQIQVPKEHQLNSVRELTIRKFMGYCTNKCNGNELSENGMTIRGSVDENDVMAMVSVFYQLTENVRGTIKKSLEHHYRHLAYIIKEYETHIRGLEQVQIDYNSLKIDYKEQ